MKTSPIAMRWVLWVISLLALNRGLPASRAAATAALEGAAEPCVIWNAPAKTWWMFCTDFNGGRAGGISVAESSDGGVTWQRRGPLALALPAEFDATTCSAPEVVVDGDRQHLFVTATIPAGKASARGPDGVPAPRRLRVVHFSSRDFRTWTYVSTIPLRGASLRGAAISAMPGGGWRMWYEEDDDELLHFADSRDLQAWTERGALAVAGPGTAAPGVFTWRGRHWLVRPGRRGLAAFRSLNLDEWSEQPAPVMGAYSAAAALTRAASVLVSGERAVCFYTVPGATTPAIHSAELVERNGSIAFASGALAPLVPEANRGGARAAFVPEKRDPSEAAQLRAMGSRDIRTHDPSTLAFCNGEYWLYHTGRGIPSWHSRDLRNWSEGPPVFASAPAWVASAVPENRNAGFWAPDVIQLGDRWLLYYSVSSFGKRTSAIALATNATLDPAAPGFQWRDEGIVVQSGTADNFNAIDPAIFRDTDGRLWLTFGSYWSGIKLLELDPQTGQRIARDAPLQAVAHSRAIEAAFLYRRGDYYYLFVNHGWCCRGVNSTYHIRVGRSAKITGPYVDRDGRAMMDGGGSVVAGPKGPLLGPGHAGIVTIEGREWFGCHFYDATQHGRPTYSLRPLSWDGQGWPVLGVVQ